MHPYLEFKKAGCDVTICSIKGGACHVAAASIAEPAYDPECKTFWENEALKALTQSTQPLASYKGTDFKTVFFVGGFGTMSDFPNGPGVQDVSKDVYEAGGIVGAVCHGQAALYNIKLSNGDYLVKGKTVCSFTNEEEAQCGNIPLPEKTCEDVMKERGATFVGGAAWSCNTQQSERLFTGQNPASGMMTITFSSLSPSLSPPYVLTSCFCCFLFAFFPVSCSYSWCRGCSNCGCHVSLKTERWIGCTCCLGIHTLEENDMI